MEVIMNKLAMLILLLFFKQAVVAQSRYTGGSSGTVPEGITVEIFTEYNRTSQYQRTYFLVSNELGEEVDVKIEAAITYTCGRVERGFIALTGGNSMHLKTRESKRSATWLKETQDKSCINIGVDGTYSTIVGITYSGSILRNNSINNKKDDKIDLVNNNRSDANTGKGQLSTDDQKGTIRKKEHEDFWNDSSGQTNLERGGDNREAYKVYEKRKEAEEKKARQDQAYVNSLDRQLAENERVRHENAHKIDAWGNNMYNTYYAAQVATEARNRLNENAKLSGNYNSVEELEEEFNQKYYSINQDVQEWNEASNQSIQSGADLLLNDGTASGQAAGELVGMLGSWVNNNKAAKEAKERKEKLEKERKAHLADLNRKKMNAILELRTKLFQQFVDGGTPLSKHQIQSSEVYCFVYSFASGSINETSPNLYVSNVFSVAQYNDGTWPFKNSLITDIKKKTKVQEIVLIGYYTDKRMAEKMRSSLINLSGKAQLKNHDIAYMRAEAQSGSIASSEDFWETGTSKDPKASSSSKANTTPIKVKEDDFWNK
jgi:hypothetical protein